jgi:putative oxidoreductase
MSFFSANYTSSSINIGLLLLRAGMCIMMIPHGYDKLVNFGQYKGQFINFLGLGPEVSLALCVFAEFFCSLFVLFGLFTRAATIPLIISTSVATFIAHGGKIFGEGEHSAMYLVVFLTLLVTGPGKYSVDGMLRK